MKNLLSLSTKHCNLKSLSIFITFFLAFTSLCDAFQLKLPDFPAILKNLGQFFGEPNRAAGLFFFRLGPIFVDRNLLAQEKEFSLLFAYRNRLPYLYLYNANGLQLSIPKTIEVSAKKNQQKIKDGEKYFLFNPGLSNLRAFFRHRKNDLLISMEEFPEDFPKPNFTFASIVTNHSFLSTYFPGLSFFEKERIILQLEIEKEKLKVSSHLNWAAEKIQIGPFKLNPDWRKKNPKINFFLYNYKLDIPIIERRLTYPPPWGWIGHFQNYREAGSLLFLRRDKNKKIEFVYFQALKEVEKFKELTSRIEEIIKDSRFKFIKWKNETSSFSGLENPMFEIPTLFFGFFKKNAVIFNSPALFQAVNFSWTHTNESHLAHFFFQADIIFDLLGTHTDFNDIYETICDEKKKFFNFFKTKSEKIYCPLGPQLNGLKDKVVCPVHSYFESPRQEKGKDEEQQTHPLKLEGKIFVTNNALDFKMELRKTMTNKP
ncbi:hypothetical protein ACFL35_02480 [Candidatus Riflebacteria bacterium]